MYHLGNVFRSGYPSSLITDAALFPYLMYNPTAFLLFSLEYMDVLLYGNGHPSVRQNGLEIDMLLGMYDLPPRYEWAGMQGPSQKSSGNCRSFFSCHNANLYSIKSAAKIAGGQGHDRDSKQCYRPQCRPKSRPITPFKKNAAYRAVKIGQGQ